MLGKSSKTKQILKRVKTQSLQWASLPTEHLQGLSRVCTLHPAQAPGPKPNLCLGEMRVPLLGSPEAWPLQQHAVGTQEMLLHPSGLGSFGEEGGGRPGPPALPGGWPRLHDQQPPSVCKGASQSHRSFLHWSSPTGPDIFPAISCWVGVLTYSI